MMQKEHQTDKKRKIGLTTQIFIALVLGAVTGIILYQFDWQGSTVNLLFTDGIFAVIGQGFIRLMRMLVVPLVFCSLVCGTMSTKDSKKMGRIGIRTMLFYFTTTALAVALALGIGALLKPGLGLNLAIAQEAESIADTRNPIDFTETLLAIIPENIFEALSQGIMLQIILFAVILGSILSKMEGCANTVKSFFTEGNDIMMELTLWVMRLAPFGVFCLIARTFAEIGFHALLPLMRYVFCVLAALAVQCFVVYLGLLKLFSNISPLFFIRNFFPVMAFAFSTSSSNAAIPMSIDILEEKLGISRKVSSFTIPLGATVNMDGTSILQGVAVMFTAQAFGISLGMADYLTVITSATLASIGTAGIPGVGLITLTMVFHSVGLPIEGIALIMGIDRILDMARTAVNVTGDAVCTAIVASSSQNLESHEEL